LAYFPYFKRKSRLMRSPCYLWIPLYQLSNAWTNLYQTRCQPQRHTSEIPPISLCLYVYPLSLLGNCSVKRYCGSEYTRNNRRLLGRVVFIAVRDVSKESRRFVVPRTSCFKIRKVH
jgi:hypothetical protein